MTQKIMVNGDSVQQPPLLQFDDNTITVAISSLSIGGAEKIVLDWAKRIYPHWKVHLIVLRNRTPDKEWPVPSCIKVTRLSNENRMQPLRHLPSVEHRRNHQLKEIGQSLAQSSNPICVCHLLTKAERDALTEGGAQVVTVLHNAKSGWVEESLQLSGSDQVISVSQSCADDLLSSGWQGPTSVIRHIPPKVDTSSDARIVYRRMWNIPETATVIGMIGAVKPQKNYGFALRVLKEVLKLRDVYLVILGGPVNTIQGRPIWEELVADVHQLGVRHRVALPGFIADASKCLPAFDLMLNTSHFEGLSIATLEALIAGVPVVASAVGGQGEITSDALRLITKDAQADIWARSVDEQLGKKYDSPSWADFPSYRLWTLAGLARTYEPSEKTLFITANLNSGGAQRSLVNLATAISGELDFSITVAGSSTTDVFYHELVKAGVKIDWTGKPWNAFGYAEKLTQQIVNEKISKVCFWNLDARIKLLLVKALGHTKVKFIDVSPGDYLYDELGEVAQFQELIAFGREEYFKRIDNLVLKYDGYRPEVCKKKTVVIPNGIPKAIKTKTDYRTGRNPRVVVSGRIAESKFIIEIIEAMKCVWETIPRTELHLYGGAELYHHEYAKKVEAAVGDEANKRIFFHGVEFDTRAYLPQYDVYVVLGKHQGCPNALMEALSVGMPSIANDDGGTKEQLIHETTGLLVPDTNPTTVAEAIVKLLTSRTFAEQLGKNAINHISEMFSIERMKNGYMKLLRNEVPDNVSSINQQPGVIHEASYH